MYVTMLDASKAFDRVNHSKLFCKLIDRGCPAFIVRILYYWYSTQTFTVRWYQGLSVFLQCVMVLNRVESFLPIFLICTWMT